MIWKMRGSIMNYIPGWMLDVGCVGLVLVTRGNVCRLYAHHNFGGVASCPQRVYLRL